MAHFLKGKYKGFYKCGPFECVKDIIRFRQFKDTSLQMELTRRDMETYLGRFLKYENSSVTLIPLDESKPRLGGKVQVKSVQLDFNTFTPSYKTLYGVYAEDFIAFGEFNKESGNPLENEEVLLKIVQEENSPAILERTMFRFENNQLSWSRDINGDVKDLEIEHPVKEITLTPMVDQSWSEVLFYGLGN